MSRGSLSLSANAIVILVLAMTILGLGIAFVNNVFSNIGQTAEDVGNQARERILDELRSGNKPLSFPTAEITVDKNREKTFAVGLRNTGDLESVFLTQILDNDGNLIEPGIEPTGEGAFGTFSYRGGGCSGANEAALLTECRKVTTTLGPDKDQILLIRFKPKGPQRTEFFTVRIYLIKEGDSWKYNDDTTDPLWTTIYAQKDFFVTVR